jgi:hypothetical protein
MLLDKKIFLFILSPALSGSSTIASLINTSPNTSFSSNIKYEGLLEIKPNPPITFKENWYNSDLVVDWSQIHQGIKWNYDKKILCDKYPPYMIRAKEMEDYFSQYGDVYFICSLRHPFACKKHQLDWKLLVEYLDKNMRELTNVHFLRYEDLIANPKKEIERLLNFLPELESLDDGKVETNHTKRGHIQGIDMNLQNYNRIFDKKEKDKISLEYHLLMKRFGYLVDEPFVEYPSNIF